MSHRQQPKPEHKATTFYIMFKAELAANAKTGPASDMDKETIMNLAPQAACDVLKVVFKVEVTVKSIKEYYDQIKDNARIAGITWDRDAAGEIIIGQVQDEPVFNRIISCLDKYRNNKDFSAETKHVLSEGWKTWPKNLEHKPKIDVQVKNRWKYMKSHEINSRIADAVLQLQSDIDPTLPSTVSEQLSSQASDYLGPSGSNA